MNNFERNIEPLKALKLGKNRSFIKKGSKFFIDFQLKKSYPEYYLQKQGIIEVEALVDEYPASTSEGLKLVSCKVPGIPVALLASRTKERDWVIS